MSVTPAYVSRHFKLEEYLPRALFEDLARTNTLWKGALLLDERLLRTDDALRDAFGALVINDWHRGGHFNESGLRLPGMATYSPTKQHAYGRASDKKSKILSGAEMRKYILEHRDKYPLLTCMEEGVSWLHTDHRNCVPIALVAP